MIRIFATGSLLFFAVSAGAQEFGIELNAGMQGVQYKVDQASPKIQMGGSLGLNYLFPFGKRWGLLTGLSGGYYHTKTTISNGALFSSNEVDGTGSAFRYNAKANGYEETNSFYSAGIPIMLQYHSLGKTQWYLNAGTKILIPFGVKTKASV
ncbi:MAG: outer membrane beta-barrel protein, partial [Chitinophagaceae bacterium]|nr:outer membrane beta-barrel protein [Chitinophagaceae bacterium]